MASSTSFFPPFSLPSDLSPLNPKLSTFPFHFPPNRKPKSSFAFHSRTKKPIGPRNLPLRVYCLRESRAAEVTKDSWEKVVVKSQVPVLVEFYASWCGPCKMVHRVIDEIAGEYAGRLNCFVLNTDNDLKIAEDYEIKAVPVVLLFKNGEKRDSVVGTMPKEFYVAAIERVLKS